MANPLTPERRAEQWARSLAQGVYDATLNALLKSPAFAAKVEEFRAKPEVDVVDCWAKCSVNPETPF
jgi:hypothetical protein